MFKVGDYVIYKITQFRFSSDIILRGQILEVTPSRYGIKWEDGTQCYISNTLFLHLDTNRMFYEQLKNLK